MPREASLFRTRAARLPGALSRRSVPPPSSRARVTLWRLRVEACSSRARLSGLIAGSMLVYFFWLGPTGNRDCKRAEEPHRVSNRGLPEGMAPIQLTMGPVHITPLVKHLRRGDRHDFSGPTCEAGRSTPVNQMAVGPPRGHVRTVILLADAAARVLYSHTARRFADRPAGRQAC